jgi:hypothetical protein
MLGDNFPEHRVKGAVKSFYRSVTRWLVPRRANLIDLHEAAQLLEQLCLKLLALVGQELYWRTKPVQHPAH